MGNVCLCLLCMPVSACLPACLWLNKGVFCISVLSSPSSPSSLTFYCELLGDWQKRSAVQLPIHLSLSPPPRFLPSLIHPLVYLHLSNPVPPRVCLCFLFLFDIKHALTVFSYSQRRLILPYNVGGVWVIGCAHAHAHTPFIHSFSLSLLFHSQATRHWPWDRWMLDPLCPVKHLIFTVCICGFLYTNMQQ